MKPIRPAQKAVDALFAQASAAKAKPKATAKPRPAQTNTANTVGALTDDALLALARNAPNGAKFKALWEGSTDGYPSESEADLALAWTDESIGTAFIPVLLRWRQKPACVWQTRWCRGFHGTSRSPFWSDYVASLA
jgi:hypothetical protein